MVDDDDRRVSAAARALDRTQRHLAVLAPLPDSNAELALECLHDLLRAHELTRDVRADLDDVLADRREVVHVIEGRNRLDVSRCEVERVGDLPERLRRQPPVLLLRQPQAVHHSRPGVWIGRGRLANLVAKSHRSTSPITVSRDPTIAIMSAISASVMHVAVASSATKEGARNFTRHGFGPPSDTT